MSLCASHLHLLLTTLALSVNSRNDSVWKQQNKQGSLLLFRAWPFVLEGGRLQQKDQQNEQQQSLYLFAAHRSVIESI
jgi:hypothetical protein